MTSTKLGSFAVLNTQPLNESAFTPNNAIPGNTPKDLALKLKKLYNLSVVSFVNQVA
jgi:hypothetical protein